LLREEGGELKSEVWLKMVGWYGSLSGCDPGVRGLRALLLVSDSMSCWLRVV